jgi:hypothetical protein
MRRTQGALAVLLALAFAPLAAVGCDQGKSGVEKRAEELAAANSAQKAQAAASASQVDPAEAKYLARKTSLEKTIREFKATEGRIMAGDATAKAGALDRYFPGDDAGKKRAKELDAKRRKEGADGFRLNRMFDPSLTFPGDFDTAEAEVTEEAGAKGLPACILYVQTWKLVSDQWVMTDQKSVKKVDCPG